MEFQNTTGLPVPKYIGQKRKHKIILEEEIESSKNPLIALKN